jgi:hypothetical protein
MGRNSPPRRVGAFPCFSAGAAEKIPLQADLIPLFGRAAEFTSEMNKINHLQGRIRPAHGPEWAFLLFFPI